uniref:Uncharacterized protein n=1 Tax=uncultured bacterium CBNPD1 BAC clone 1664 TaxID=417310 RepID=B1N6M7_9BACT|nr:hypothetical protein [uncultured bacterium CBNPD1 BAC clone 1664]
MDLLSLGRVVVLHRDQPDLPGAEVEGLEDVELGAFRVDGQVVDAPRRAPVRQEVIERDGGHLVALALRPGAGQAVALGEGVDGGMGRDGRLVEDQGLPRPRPDAPVVYEAGPVAPQGRVPDARRLGEDAVPAQPGLQGPGVGEPDPVRRPELHEEPAGPHLRLVGHPKVLQELAVAPGGVIHAELEEGDLLVLAGIGIPQADHQEQEVGAADRHHVGHSLFGLRARPSMARARRGDGDLRAKFGGPWPPVRSVFVV